MTTADNVTALTSDPADIAAVAGNKAVSIVAI
jgi:hypothetical protein